MSTAPTITLPPIPPVPPPAAPTNAALVPAWQTLWQNYHWAVEQHAEEACRAEQRATRVAFASAGVSMTDGIERALMAPRRVGKADVVLAVIQAVPPTIRPTESAWAGDVMAVANALWDRMQADAVINPPPAAPTGG